ncbi:hypothetical protein COU58_02460 [Candidatus Pacearchaeota archaeon CG10_big_fil_rev_8_21_14_0_10_32_42]|nr:MAG: hypothetical protein COU58_02460 [Candidatus Pacearchaeota archaeon CG10_big_fil_rev_8_21_14_0_10_32_42]
MKKKLILLENISQAKEFLAHSEKFKECLPITFNLMVEKILSEKGIKFKVEEEYEKKFLYKNIHEESIRATWKLCQKIQLKYLDIQIVPLFYYNIYLIIALEKKYLRLLREIIKEENPEEIIIFKSKSGFDKEHFSGIMENVFNGKIKIRNYHLKTKKNEFKSKAIQIVGRIQKLITKIRLNFYKNKNEIFVSGGKIYFENLVKELLKDKKNKIINFDNKMRKSFLIGGNYLPFYEFSGRKNVLQNALKWKFLKLRGNWEKKDLSKISGFEKELEETIKKKVFFMVGSMIPMLSESLEEFSFLLKNKKIDLVLLIEEDSPFSRGIVQLSRKFKIPTLSFQHGFFPNEMSNFVESPYYFVLGENQKNIAEKVVSNKTEINIIGCPRYDYLLKEPVQKKQILYAMEVANEDILIPNFHLTKKRQKEILRGLFRELKKFPDYKLILKIRPGWDLKEMLYLISKEESYFNFEVIEKTDNAKLINESELVIINHTTMGIEALILGKPVISYTYRDLAKVNPYTRFKEVKKVYSQKEFGFAMKEILSRKSIPKYNLSKEIVFDGKSSLRASKIINSILSSKIGLSNHHRYF